MNLFAKIFPHRIWKKRFNDLQFRRKKILSRKGQSSFYSRLHNRNDQINFGKWSISKAKLLKYSAIVVFVGLIFMTLSTVALFAWYAKDLPQPDKIVRKEGFATKIYDRSGKLLYEVFADEKRIPVSLNNVSDSMKKATVAVEDKNFYNHQGFDILSYPRIAYNILFKHRVIGGSTLTQQIVKNILLTSDRTIARKMKELILAIQIESKYSKDEILQIYLNEAPYGGTAWGIAAASNMYFDKDPRDLTLTESAILAGMPQSPSYYSPYGAHPEAFKGRTQDVLRRMREDGYITKDQEQQSIKDLDSVKFKPQGGDILAPHFVMYVKSLLEERYGQSLVEQGGLQVYTTLDYALQEKVQQIVTDEIAKVAESQHITNGAAMIMDPKTGEILSMVGSKDYFAQDYDGNVNVALSLRQPGSSIKPVTYLTALHEGYTPESILMDVETEFPGVSEKEPYKPKNYNGKFVGPVTLRNALGNSLNIPAVKLLALVGVDDMMQMGYEMGLPSFEPTQEEINRVGLSITLGGGEVRLLDLTSAYSAFANGGKKVEPISVTKVVDKDGKILEEYKQETGKQVITPEEAYMISDMLSDDNARLLTFGANSLLNITGRTVAVKTGTTDDMRDNWTIGWTPQLIVGVWVGNNDNSKMKSVASGISGASPIWRNSLLAALESFPVVEFEKPAGIETVFLDKLSGYPAHDGFEAKEAKIIQGTAPTGADPIHVKLKVCKSDESKLAPVAVVARDDFIEKEFYVFKESDPLYGDSDNHWQKGIDAWVNSQSDSKYHPPTEYCENGDEIGIRFETPTDHNKVNNKFEIKIRVGTSGGDIEKVTFYANDKQIGETQSKPYKMDADLTDGTYTLKAKAYRTDGKTAETTIKIGVNKEWDWAEPTPTPTPTSTPKALATPTPTLTITPTPTPGD
ncbi:penicillin-binding protein [Candidatus Beckwithbacteria bacterium]|nr:penicillin-binding protein [Candidatus Beckwithbacteria bacterium]